MRLDPDEQALILLELLKWLLVAFIFTLAANYLEPGPSDNATPWPGFHNEDLK